MTTRKTVFIAVLIAFTLVVAACTGVQTSGEAASPQCNEMEIAEVDGKYDLGGCVLRIAVENAYNPFNFINEAGEAVGYDYDIFNEICQRINCQPDFVATSWDALIAVMGGEGTLDTFDIGADGITITEERAKNVAFSDPYVTSVQALLVASDEDRFTGPEDFAANPDLIVGTQLGTTNYEVAKNLVGEDRITAYDIFGTAVQALINGDVDAVIIDNVAGIGYVGVDADKLKIIGEAIESEELAFIFGLDSPLIEPINQTLAEMEADGTIDELRGQWFAPGE